MTRIDEALGGGIDPWVAFDGQGHAYVVSMPPAEVRRSTDGGLTWSEPVVLPRGRGGREFDYTKLLVDRTGGRYDGRVYVIAAQSRWLCPGFRIDPISVLASDDGGRSFRDPVEVWPANIDHQNGTGVVLSDGTLLVGFHELSVGGDRFQSPRLWVARSTDGGETFGPPSIVVENFVADSPDFAVDASEDGTRRDRVYAAWMGLNGEYDHYLSHSSDGGTTWSKPLRVNDGEANTPTHHPAIAVTQAGIVGMAWMDSRYDPDGRAFPAFMFTASTDGGGTVMANVQVAAPARSDTLQNEVTFSSRDITIARRWPDGGDYHGLVGLDDGAFQAAWVDSRTGVFQLWTARIEVDP